MGDGLDNLDTQKVTDKLIEVQRVQNEEEHKEEE